MRTRHSMWQSDVCHTVWCIAWSCSDASATTHIEEKHNRGTRQDDSLLLVAQSSGSLCRGKYQTAHGARSGETGCQSRCYLERKEKKHTKRKLHPLLPVSESRNEICFAHLFPLLSSTLLTNKLSLQRMATQISGCSQIICLPCSAQFSCTRAFSFQGSHCLMALPDWRWALTRWASPISTLTPQGLGTEMAPGLPFCHLQRCNGGAGTGEKLFLAPVWDQSWGTLLAQCLPFCMTTAALSSRSTYFPSCSWCQYLKKSRDFLWRWGEKEAVRNTVYLNLHPSSFGQAFPTVIKFSLKGTNNSLHV